MFEVCLNVDSRSKKASRLCVSVAVVVLIRNMGDLKMETIDEIFNCLTKGLGLLEIELKKNLNDKLTDESRLTYMKTIKIFIYLLVEYTNFVERKMVKASQDDFLSTTMTAKVRLLPSPSTC
jgi:hypothetical protein